MTMNRSLDAYPDRGRRHRGFRSLLVLPLLVLVAALVIAYLRRGSEAEISLGSSLPGVGTATQVTVDAVASSRGLTSVALVAVQGEQRLGLAEVDVPAVPWWAFWRHGTTRQTLEAEIGRQAWPALQPGEVTLRAEATTAGSPLGGPRTSVSELVLPVRLMPPGVGSLSDTDVVRQGGTGLVTYFVGESSVRDGVRVGEHFFPGADLPSATTERQRFAFFAVPHDMDEPSEIRLAAEDELGNRIEKPFLQRFDRRRLETDDIQVADGFLEDVVPEIQAHTPSLQPSGILVDDYVAINRDLRIENRQQLLELGRDSRDELLWNRSFLQMPNSRVMAGFGADRTYLYDGRVIDRQTHLGYDLASVRHAEVPAAADGVVVLAEFFGIYGNTVVLDHGYGLMTLYSHLSRIDVAPGDPVARGDTVGRTGTTGLAGGDHLHFAVLVRGVQVDPLEWLDPNWIDTRIAGKLGEALELQK